MTICKQKNKKGKERQTMSGAEVKEADIEKKREKERKQ